MAYIGRVPQVGNYFTLDAITTSSTATYNLLKGGVAYVPETAYHLFVSLNGVIQAPITAYTVSGSTIIFASSLSGTDVIDFITVLGDTLAIGTPSDDTVATASLKANAVTDAKIADVAATKLTGSIADARVPASAVTQHVTGYDDSAIRADISALALREATNETSAAFNLPNSFIDTFTDDTNLGTQTDCDRVSGSIGTVSTPVDSNWSNVYFLGNESTTNGTAGASGAGSTTNATYDTGVSITTGSKKWGTNGIDFTSGRSNGTAIEGFSLPGNGFKDVSDHWTLDMWIYQTARNSDNAPPNYDDSAIWALSDTYASINIGSGGRMRMYQYEPANYTEWDSSYALPLNTWVYLSFTWDSTHIKLWADGVYKGAVARIGLHSSTPDTFRFGSSADGQATSRYIGYMDDIRLTKALRQTGTGSITVPTTAHYPNNTVANATGTLIQSANAVGSAKTEVSGTILYKDNAGTATLGTDFKIYFTCNGGSNWTEAASYNAITPVYATGIKQVRLGKTACTSGTDIRYKAVWANQAASSKETQLHGIGINY